VQFALNNFTHFLYSLSGFESRMKALTVFCMKSSPLELLLDVQNVTKLGICNFKPLRGLVVPRVPTYGLQKNYVFNMPIKLCALQ
jgi:hypothetical protein